VAWSALVCLSFLGFSSRKPAYLNCNIAGISSDGNQRAHNANLSLGQWAIVYSLVNIYIYMYVVYLPICRRVAEISLVGVSPPPKMMDRYDKWAAISPTESRLGYAQFTWSLLTPKSFVSPCSLAFKRRQPTQSALWIRMTCPGQIFHIMNESVPGLYTGKNAIDKYGKSAN